MIINAVMGSNLFNTMFALVIVAWPSYARVMRSVVLSVRENEYVTASEALGFQIPYPAEGNYSEQYYLCSDHWPTTDIGNQIPDVLHIEFPWSGFCSAQHLNGV